MLPLEIFYIYFSPYTAHALNLNGVIFPTLEHAYQCARYTDLKIIEEVKSASSPVKAWNVSSKYKQFQIPEFKDDDYKLKIMMSLTRLKVEQHEDVRNVLLNSGNQKIVKHIVSGPPADGFWDDGYDGQGLNHIGRIWMEIRNELRVI